MVITITCVSIGRSIRRGSGRQVGGFAWGLLFCTSIQSTITRFQVVSIGEAQAAPPVIRVALHKPRLQGTDKISGYGGEPWAARQRHGQIELLTQHLQNGLDPGFSTDRQSPEYRAPYQHCPRAISHRFEHVGSTPDHPEGHGSVMREDSLLERVTGRRRNNRMGGGRRPRSRNLPSRKSRGVCSTRRRLA